MLLSRILLKFPWISFIANIDDRLIHFFAFRDWYNAGVSERFRRLNGSVSENKRVAIALFDAF